MKITAKFRASRRLRFEDTKRIKSPEMRPKSFGTFEKQAPGPQTCILFKRCITLSTGKITSSSEDRPENQSNSVAPGQRFVRWIALSFQLGRIG